MSVFLSHKKIDREIALQVANYLISRSVPCYVDEFDPILQNTNDITSTIIQRVRDCTHLMAIVSSNTQYSWWVPFEIGVASEIEKRITSCKVGSISLPEYLEKWPIIKNDNDLDQFINFYHRDNAYLAEGRQAQSYHFSSADEFHRQLKVAIRQ